MIREENWNRLHSFLEECVEKGVFPGADFAMVTKDEVKTMVVGNKQLLPEVLPNEGNTIWDLASISKVLVTTTCVLKLMEEGLITLKTKVCDVIPEFNIYVVWQCKVLQNWKFLISTSLIDGMYYEVTYNGDKDEWYLDAYKKFENKCIRGNQE